MLPKAKCTLSERLEMSIREEINRSDLGLVSIELVMDKIISSLTQRITEIVQDEIKYGRLR